MDKNASCVPFFYSYGGMYWQIDMIFIVQLDNCASIGFVLLLNIYNQKIFGEKTLLKCDT